MQEEESDELVCFCHGVSRKTLLQAINEGAHTLADLQDKTKASTGCGGCEPEVLDLLKRFLPEG